MSSVAIKINNISKIYKLYDKPMDRLKEALGFSKKTKHKDYYALKNVNLEINKGEIIGIIGTNGSGKSTLLKIVTGVLNPTEGSVEVNGRISALLELGAGFNPEYTGIQNIYLNGTMVGKTKQEIDDEIEKIVEFADIGDFINQPVKTYSSGMFVRLAFAVATNINPDILVVDEALSVGDISFQMKSINKIKELIQGGTTVLFVSHDIITIKSLCQKTLYLHKGELMAYGDSGEICDLYLANQNRNSKLTVENNQRDNIRPNTITGTGQALCNHFIDTQFEHEANKVREGTGKVRVKNILIEDSNQKSKKEFYYNETVNIKIYFELEEDVSSLVVACYIRNRNQLEIIGTNCKYENIQLKNLKKGSRHEMIFSFKNYLQEGEYSITTILADDIPTTQFYDVVNNIVMIKSYDKPNQKRWALVGIPMDVEYSEV